MPRCTAVPRSLTLLPALSILLFLLALPIQPARATPTPHRETPPTARAQCNFDGVCDANETATECPRDCCAEDEWCDDGVFCNGQEKCEGGSCVNGPLPCGSITNCNEDLKECVVTKCKVNGVCEQGEDANNCPPDCCVVDEECDDQLFCNGRETCIEGSCVSGIEPCPIGTACIETYHECVRCDFDGVCDVGEDAATCPSDCCRSDDQCNDGVFCNGQEACVDGTCALGTPPCPQGTTCIETSQECVRCDFDGACDIGEDASSCPSDCCARDEQCNDGFFCNGEETCVEGTCALGTPPCPPGTKCVETLKSCIKCNYNGVCEEGEDGKFCPTDCCAADEQCGDGVFCNGVEKCDNGNCVPGPTPCPQGTVCVETSQQCFRCNNNGVCEDGEDATTCPSDCCASDAQCDDGNFCNGAEQCLQGRCIRGTPPCPSLSLCDETKKACLTCNFNGRCERGENCTYCPSDCIWGGGIGRCGNGVCEPAYGEGCRTCPDDCPGVVVGRHLFCCGETATCEDRRCRRACGARPGEEFCCGDGICGGKENPGNCVVDCPV